MICGVTLTSKCGDTVKLPLDDKHNKLIDFDGLGHPTIEVNTRPAIGRAGAVIDSMRHTGRLFSITQLLCSCGNCGLSADKEELYHALNCEGGCSTSADCVQLTGLDQKYYFKSAEEPQFKNADCTLTFTVCGKKGRRTRRSLKVKLADVQESRFRTNLDGQCTRLELSFIAPYPYSYNPSIQCVDGDVPVDSVDPDAKVCFPICEPFTPPFEHCVTVPNNGYINSFPKIFLYGQWQNPVIKNKTTGAEIALDYTIREGEVVTVDLGGIAPPSIVSSNGRNLMTYGAIGLDTCLSDFYLKPQCDNEICLSGRGLTGSTQFRIWSWEWFRGVV